MSIKFTPYKGRSVSKGDKVIVYRNLHQDGLTIKKDGLVCGHAKVVELRDVKFHVSKRGNERVREEGVKNVHAYLIGTLHESVEDINLDYLDDYYNAYNNILDSVYYNPYKVDSFVYFNSMNPIQKADRAIIIMDRIYV